MQKMNGNSLFLPPQRHTFAHRKKKNCPTIPVQQSFFFYHILFFLMIFSEFPAGTTEGITGR